jgi:hypothetical protein
LKIDVGEIDRNAPAGFASFNVAFFKLIDQRLVFCNFGPLLINRSLLLGLFYLLPLELIAYKCSGAQAKRAANGRPDSRSTHCGSNDTTGRRAAEGADSGAFFTSR